MAYRVLAVKYRPATFEQVIGQQAAVTTLQNALRDRRIAHGYIFAGVRGVGKTTMARLFAKALNCVNGPTPAPCGQCPSCLEIPEGRSMDVFEIDGASNSKVDEMRDLLETTRYAPARDRYKIFIIDEFHQISRHAFNALLKTLEEPPPYVVFIMATTELDKVPETIPSRCQVFEFRRLALPAIASQLRRIADQEAVKVSDRTLALAARAAGGSMRDAVTALDQVIAACGDTVADDAARQALGVISEEEVEAFFAAVAERDAPALLRLIARLSDAGQDPAAFGAELHDQARRLLIARTLPDAGDLLEAGSEAMERTTALAARFGEDDLLRLVTMIEGAQPSLRYAAQPRYLLESLAVRLARLAHLVSLDELLARPAAGVSSAEAAAQAPAPAAGPAPTATGDKKKILTPAAALEPAPAPAAEGSPLPAAAPVGTSSLFERMLARLETEKPSLATMLADVAGAEEREGALILPVPVSSSARTRLARADTTEALTGIATALAGRPVRVKVVVAGTAPAVAARAASAPASPAPQPRTAQAAPVRPGAPAPPPAGGEAAAKRRVLTERALADPGVRQVMEIFNARVVDIEEKG